MVQRTGASRALMNEIAPVTSCRRSFFRVALFSYYGRKEKISISHPFMLVNHSIRYPSGSGNRPEWQHSLPLSEAIRKGTRPKLRPTESLPTTLMSGFLRTFKELLQTLLDFQSLPLNGS